MREQIKQEMLKMKEVLKSGYYNIGNFRGNALYLHYVKDDGVTFYGYDENRNWRKVTVSWEEMTESDLTDLQNNIKSLYPEKLDVVRENYMIRFNRPTLKESIICNLKERKFTKVYATGKERDIKYPNAFFKGYEGRLVVQDIPTDDQFQKMMNVIIEKEWQCKNFGTFLVRMFDNIHLETYIAAGVEFDNRIDVPYNYFDKDIRKILDSRKMKYDSTIQKFFMNKDIGRSLMFAIAEREDFDKCFNWLASNMAHVVNLVENYNYNVRSLWRYWEAREFKSGTHRYGWDSGAFGYNADIISYMVDYVRMAEAVYGGDFIEQVQAGNQNIEVEETDEKADFPKYPKDLKRAHDYVQTMHQALQERIDEEKFKKTINEKLEWKKGDFLIVHPKSSMEIRYEGNQLSHCVGSYVKRVVSGETRILFLRHKDKEQEPLVTLEVRDNRITQARGQHNRGPSYDEKVFLEEYAKEKKLTYGTGYY